MRIGLIGGGFMGEAIISALLKGGVVTPSDVTVSDIAEARRTHLTSTYKVTTTTDNAEAAKGADVVLLAVKPQEFAGVAAGLKGKLTAQQTALSIMAGVPIERIAEGLGHKAVVRAMPNTAAFVGQAMSVWNASEAVSEQGRAAAAKLLGAVGRELPVSDEKYLDMATAVNGSGPGFIFLFLEAFIDGAVHVGLRREVAEQLATQTLLGAATMAQEMGKHPAELRNMVTSPGGTTAAELQVLEEAGLHDAVVGAVEAAYRRAQELSG